MSSLNPFSARREKKEAAVRDKLDALQQQQLDRQPLSSGLDSGDGGGELMSESQLAALLPERSYESEDFDKYLPASAKVDQPATGWSPGRGNTYEAPSRTRQCFGRLQNAFVIGASLGGAVGFMYGTYAAIAYKHVLYLPVAVLQAAGGFGFFLACGTVIRCDELPELQRHADAMALRRLEASPVPHVARKQRFEDDIDLASWAIAGHAHARSLVSLHCSAKGRSAVVEAIADAPQSRWLA